MLCNFSSGVTSPYAKYQLASKLSVCSKDCHPLLFNFRPDTSQLWVQDLTAVSGRGDGRLDAVDLLSKILNDGINNHAVSSLQIPKEAFIKDQGDFPILKYPKHAEMVLKQIFQLFQILQKIFC